MANKKIPMRQCVGCGQMKAKKDMVRVIKTPEDAVLLDATGRKNGRGAYICANPDCLKQARKSKGLERSLKMAIPQEVYDSLEKEMNTLAE
ncbi:MAG: YlxR family protein [Lachnospiraceae bacterium]|nr:YlxR family protein [Lachnospiraceae bacterium]